MVAMVLLRLGTGYASPRATACCLRSSASAFVGRPRFFFGGSLGSFALEWGAPSGRGWIIRPPKLAAAS